MIYLYLISFLFMLLPGIYLATKKNFLIFQNEKYNTFLIRLFFTVPIGLCLSLFISILSSPIVLIVLLFSIAFGDFLSVGSVLTFSLIFSSLFLIFVLKNHLIQDDLPPEFDPNFMNHELYVYLPHQKFLRRGNSVFFFPISLFFDSTLFSDSQKENLNVDFRYLENKDIVFTDLGEIIVSERALSVFSKNGFDDSFETKSVIVSKGLIRRSAVKNPYFHLIPKNMMPSLHPKTKIKKTYSFFFYSGFMYFPNLVVDDKFYYNRNVLGTISDFNATSEALGAYGIGHQKLWIVSKKAMEVLLTELNQHKRDFIPVMLIDNEDLRKEQK